MSFFDSLANICLNFDQFGNFDQSKGTWNSRDSLVFFSIFLTDYSLKINFKDF